MFQGYVEYVQAFRIYGWAFSGHEPDRRLTVEIVCGDTILGRTTADVFRDDLRQSSIGDGAHGFVFDFVENLNNAELQNLEVRVLTNEGKSIPLERLIYTPSPTLACGVERASASVYPGAHSDFTQHPLFILGGARSGTSAIAQAYLSTGRFWGHKEGHILDLLVHLADSVRSFYDQKERSGALNRATFISQVPIEFFQQGLQHIFVGLIRTMAPAPWWIDKTPSHHMIQLAPHFLAMWPNAKFVFLKRRALEFVESRRRKFPQMPFETHCREWVAIMTAWSKVSWQLNGRVLEIDQLYMAHHPEAIAATASALVNLNPGESTLFLQSLTHDRPEQTTITFADVLCACDLTWSRTERAAFDAICAPTMAKFGYSMDESYRIPRGPHAWLRCDGLPGFQGRLS